MHYCLSRQRLPCFEILILSDKVVDKILYMYRPDFV